MSDPPVLEVSGLSVDYVLDRGSVRAVDDVSFTVSRGEFLGIVGESGCGKSTLLFAVAQLLAPPAAVAAGTVMFGGQNLVGLTDGQLSAIRWRDMSVVMQSAMNALNPVKTIGAQFKDASGRTASSPARRSPTAPPRCSGWLASTRYTWGATRTSCPAGCGSGR